MNSFGVLIANLSYVKHVAFFWDTRYLIDFTFFEMLEDASSIHKSFTLLGLDPPRF